MISTFILIITVAISNIVAKFLPFIPATYINLLAGVILGMISITDRLILGFNESIFMTLILAPLLFFEGQGTTILLVRKNFSSIVGTAVILAVVSAGLVTLLIHNLFALTIPIALIIAAISTPTDATAFDSVIEGRKIRPVIQNTLKMESLFNDATGIILLQAGLLWLRTGHLSVQSNLLTFFKMAGGGALIGIVLSFALIILRQSLLRSTKNVVSAQTLIYLITPFLIYLLAERFATSGIIAVVVAGLVHNSEAYRSRFSSPRQMYFGSEMSNFINQILSGAVFVILGISLKRIFTDNLAAPIASNWAIIGLIAYSGLLISRYVYARFKINDRNNKTAIEFALGGVHGTVTLAMTFALIEVIPTNLFNYIILIETTIIILSMMIPWIVFKFILPKDQDQIIKTNQLNKMRNEMVHVGLTKISEMNLSQDVKELVVYDIKDQNQSNNLSAFFNQWQTISRKKSALTSLQSVEQRRALMYAFDAEREYLYNLAKQNLVNSSYVYEIYSEILLSESLVLNPADNSL